VTSKAEDLLKTFKSKQSVSGAFVATRSGLYIGGPVPEGKHRDTFVAMAAIIHGGAETSALELGTPLKTIVINFSDSQMLIMGIGTKALLTVTAASMTDDLVSKSEHLAKDLEPLM
jgi:predicted regulator of Ras-like GTPase activity (Roadblock/LC7/MglB family)